MSRVQEHMLRVYYKIGLLFLFIGLFASSACFGAEQVQRVGPVEVSLVSEYTTIAPGEPFEIGLRIKPDPDWHVYWKNPGDAGLPPTLKWQLAEGFAAADIRFAVPDLIPAGPLAAYGYYGEVLYPVTLSTPAELEAGDTVMIGLEANWLVCKEECIPGKASFSIPILVAGQAVSAKTDHADLFERTRSRYPSPWPPGWTVSAEIDNQDITITVDSPDELGEKVDLYFFSSEKAVVEHGAEQDLRTVGESYELTVKRSPYSVSLPDSLRGILRVSNDVDTTFLTLGVNVVPNGRSVARTESQAMGLILALVLAFAGGMVLNLMPCVLPVLSLKILGLVEQANQSGRSLFLHGAGFSLGVMASFWALAILLMILQAGGAQLGWGFQLQSPTFVMVMAGAIFLLALNMFGLFEITFLARSVGGSSSPKGLGGAILSGVTATLLATPCTAPFMGTALGYSLTQPPLISLLVYTSLGAGMAAPYLLLTLFPGLLRFVPKPGRWIETLKQGLGFVLIATVVWLAWVLSLQTDSMGIVVLHSVLLLLAVAAWVFGRWSTVSSRLGTLVRAVVPLGLVVLALAGGSMVLGTSAGSAETSTVGATKADDWEKFSQNRLDSLRADGQPVFVDFTAAWCLSCKVNERVALAPAEVMSRFKNLNVTLLKADWTRRSPEITKALASFGRNSVPLYVLYGPGQMEPEILPAVLTTGIVHEALDRLEQEDLTP